METPGSGDGGARCSAEGGVELQLEACLHGRSFVVFYYNSTELGFAYIEGTTKRRLAKGRNRGREACESSRSLVRAYQAVSVRCGAKSVAF